MITFKHEQDIDSLHKIEWNGSVTELNFRFQLNQGRNQATIMAAIISYFADVVAKLAKRLVQVNMIHLYHDFYGPCDTSRQMGQLVEVLGRIATQCTMFINFDPKDIECKSWGNIVRLYSMQYNWGFTNLKEWAKTELTKTRIIDLGVLRDGKISRPRDMVTIAEDILKDPDNAGHPVQQQVPELAFRLRTQRDLVRARNQACVTFALHCKQQGVPRDVMRLMTAQVNPGDWDFNTQKKRNLTTRTPAWATKIVKSYKKRAELANTASQTKDSRIARESEYERIGRRYKELPNVIVDSKKREKESMVAVEAEETRLRDLCGQMTTDEYGRPQPPRKFRKKEGLNEKKV